MKNTSARGITTLAIWALALAALAGASRSRADTLTVTTLNDSGPGSLRQAIADAAPGDTITFSVTGDIMLTSGALTISTNLDLQGPGPDKLQVSGNHANRVFFIQSGTVTLAGVTITNGLANGLSPDPPSAGGGVLNAASASLTLSNVVVAGNTALGDASKIFLGFTGVAGGGGVANFGTLQVTACQLTGNRAQGADASSGGPFAPGGGTGGALANLFGVAHVTGSQLTGNVVQGGSGCVGQAAGFGNGGAIGNLGTLSITHSTFSQNQALGGNGNSGMLSGVAASGAIQSESWGIGSPWLEVSHSRFDHNQAIGGNVNSGIFSSIVFGGAIHFANCPGTVSDCTLGHNQALGGVGGPGANGGDGCGGGLDAEGAGSIVTVTDCTVEQNTALGGPGGPGGIGGNGSGGGLRSGGGATLTVINTTAARNHAQGGAGLADGTGGNGWGGGFMDYQATLTLEGASVTNNLAVAGSLGGQGIGGGVYVFAPSTNNFDATTVIQDNHASTSHDNVGPIEPALNISRQTDNSLGITWPAWATDFTLKGALSLPSSNWVPVPGVQGNRAVLQPTDPQRFYRLEKQ
ncbi:MAG: hypothetical protein AB9869_34095 [Verrucomicrobiia bacterium]